MKKANLNCKISSISTSEHPAKLIRPLNSRLSKKSIVENGFKLLPKWEDALNRYLIEIINLDS